MPDSLAVVIFIATLIAAFVVVYRPLGDYMADVLTTKKHLRVEKVVYKLGGVDADVEQTTWRYIRSVLAFSVVSVGFLYLFLRVQQHFWPPSPVTKMTSAQAVTPTATCCTNTTWTSYPGGGPPAPSHVSPVDWLHRMAPRPLRLLHAVRDFFVHPNDGRALYDAAAQPKQLHWLPRSWHATVHRDDRPVYEKMLVDFFHTHLGDKARRH